MSRERIRAKSLKGADVFIKKMIPYQNVLIGLRNNPQLLLSANPLDSDLVFSIDNGNSWVQYANNGATAVTATDIKVHPSGIIYVKYINKNGARSNFKSIGVITQYNLTFAPLSDSDYDSLNGIPELYKTNSTTKPNWMLLGGLGLGAIVAYKFLFGKK